MKAKALRGEEQATDINISPLIDMVFILLIFFIVTTVFVDENGLGIETPVPVPPSKSIDNEPFVLRITEGGAIYHAGKEIGIQGVGSAIINARNEGSLDSVTIEVHDNTKVAIMTQVFDVCSALEVEKVVTKRNGSE